jgi:hypothetical protein
MKPRKAKLSIEGTIAEPKIGRPSEFSQEVVNEICERMQAGETLTAICKDDHLPVKTTILRWLDAHTPFQTQYARARTSLMDHYADQIVEIAFEGSNTDNVAVQRDRLKVDSLKWIMSKLGHKKYGDRLALEAPSDSPQGEPLKIQWIDVRVVDPPNALKDRIAYLEGLLGMQDGEQLPPKLLTHDPGPLPSRFEGSIIEGFARMVKATVPRADQRSPEEVLEEVLSISEAALRLHYRHE